MHPRSARKPAVQRLWPALAVVLILLQACNLPIPRIGRGQATPTPGAGPTPSETIEIVPVTPVEGLPPALVETDPPASSRLSVNAPLTLYFNQPMERESVEAAFKVEPAVSASLQWIDDSTLQVLPEQALEPGSLLAFSVAGSARAQNGESLREPISLQYQAAAELRLSDRLPSPGTTEIDPRAAIVASFDQPVVPLGDTSGAPAAFVLDPPAEGDGRWLNTSTYIFTADPALQGGVRYTVEVNPELVSTAGTPLADTGDEWWFTTAQPRLLGLEPGSADLIWLDQEFSLSFNQSMDAALTEGALSLSSSSGETAPLEFEWNEDSTVLTVKPAQPLARSASFTLRLSASAAGLGGTPIEQPYEQSFTTLPDFAVAEEMVEGVNFFSNRYFTIRFTSPLAEDQVLSELISFEPAVEAVNSVYSWNPMELYVDAPFQPDTDYEIILSPQLRDRWGQSLGQEVRLRLIAQPPDPALFVPALQSMTLFLTPEDTMIPAFASGVQTIDLFQKQSDLAEYIDFLVDYTPPLLGTGEDSWQVTLPELAPANTPIELPVSPNGAALDPGMYVMNWRLSGLPSEQQRQPFFAAVSRYNLAIKAALGEALVWAVDLQSNTPAAGMVVSLLDTTGTEIGQAETDEDGLARFALPPDIQPSDALIALSGAPGEDAFAIGLTEWASGLGGWDFHISTDYWRPAERLYLYTDRPIYRPGQTVYFRLVGMRPTASGYVPMSGEEVALQAMGTYSYEQDRVPTLMDAVLTLSEFGTGEGFFTLPEDAPAGAYSFVAPDHPGLWVSFQVASYRKPEIDLQIQFDRAEFFRGGPLSAQIDANYFFGADAGGQQLTWRLYARSHTLPLPDGYSSGTFPFEFSWFDFGLSSGPGILVAEGEGVTAADGSYSWQVSNEEIADQLPDDELLTLTLEATITDASGLPVSAKSEALLAAGDYVIGLRSERWSVEAGDEIGFDVKTFDLLAQPSPDRTLRAEFSRVIWQQRWLDWQSGQAETTVEKIPAGSTDFVTGADGEARVTFIPPDPGTYLLTVSGEGATSELLVWVRGEGEVQWPELPNQQIEIELDRSSYVPGDTASLLIPNPFQGESLVLFTVERDQVLHTELYRLDQPSLEINLPIESNFAPNVYISAILLGRGDQGIVEYRMGLADVPVAPVEQQLNVHVVIDPPQAGPGETVTVQVDARDPSGQPAQAELSLAVVDKALLALAAPNASSILEAFYGHQPLRVKTAMPLAAHAARLPNPSFGRGGGGGGDMAQAAAIEPQSEVRGRFEDTALWAGALLTDENGQASIAVQLPDNLTTWVAQARGLTTGALVGEASVEVTASKPLLIRPVTPRFLVAGDHLRLSGVIHNNTAQSMTVETRLQVDGFTLDDDQPAEQTVEVPAGGSQAVGWWGTAGDGEQVQLQFSARSGNFTDATTPLQGSIPVLRFVAPQTFGTAGVMTESGERLEVVSLPRSFDPAGGHLLVELSPSLAATVLSGLDALEVEPRDWAWPVVSALMPNAAALQMVEMLDLEDGELRTRLIQSVQEGINWLNTHQQSDGGWSHSNRGESDPHLTAYALLAISTALQAGAEVPDAMVANAQNLLTARLIDPQLSTEVWQLDLLAFEHYALTQSGMRQIPPTGLLPFQERLSPWARALLAASLLEEDSAAEEARGILQDLQATAIRSSTGVSWPAEIFSGHFFARTVSATAIVTAVLARHDPAAAVLSDAVRFLAANRRQDGGWGSSYETAWVLLAFQRVMQGTGELQADYDFSAELNGQLMASGNARDELGLLPLAGQAPIAAMVPDQPNALEIIRGEGSGRLYYRAYLEVSRTAAEVAPLSQGLSIERVYYPSGQNCLREECQPLEAFSLSGRNNTVLVQVTLTVPEDQYNLVIEDVIPAGSEIADASLLTTAYSPEEPAFDPIDPFGTGYAWWYFSQPRYDDDRVRWVADFLPAGSYTLTYRLTPTVPGEFQVLPARSWAYFFPEVQAHSAGQVIGITE